MSWVLPTATARYVVSLAPDRAGLVLDHWGEGDGSAWRQPSRLHFETGADVLPLEYTALGTRQVRGSDLVVDHGDSLVGARLVWDGGVELVQQDGRSTLTAGALDTTGHLRVVLHIVTSTDHEVVRKWVELHNVGGQPLTLPRAFGAGWELPVGPGARVGTLSGEWSREFTPTTVDLPAGELSIGSRQGVTSHSYAPVVTVSPRTEAGSTPGAYGIALAWSGSWRLSVDAVPFRSWVRVSAGVDDESTVVTLLPGESFTTPATLGVFAPQGTTGLPRRWHDYQRSELARSIGLEHRPIVYNSWYATGFDVQQTSQVALADIASEIGAEVFVVDDGWFTGRTSDRAGLGDWAPDPAKFPDGLDPLVEAVLARGMRFGLWVEPEAVNPDSELFRAHPDWVYRAGDRPLVTVRNQHVLDLGRPEVLAWVKEMLRGVLADRRISYLKWDMNRPISDGGRPGDVHGRQWSVQHALGYYQLMQQLRDEFPDVTVEACASGGGRVDLAVLGLSDVVWPSDETGPRDRLSIQHGFLTAYGPHVMSSWVTDEPDRLDREPASFEFRFLVAMAGVLGVGSDLLAWTAEQRTRAAELITTYRDVRALVHRGRVEVHGTPQDPVYALEYGGDAELDHLSCLLVYTRPGRPEVVTLRPRTLAPDRRYRLRGTDRTFTGAEAAAGLAVPFTVSRDADLLVLEPVR